MLLRAIAAAALVVPSTLGAQAPGRWPPDSLINVRVFARSTPVDQVISWMRNITGHLDVRCEFCHVGRPGQPLEEFDFASDEKRTKQVARQMLLMQREINRRLDTLPGPDEGRRNVTCGTCHRGVTRPVPLSTLIAEAAETAGLDSAARAYRSLRARYYGSDAYDFSESSLNAVASRLARAGRFDEAFGLLGLNEEYFPQSSGMHVLRGVMRLMQGDTTAAANAFEEALRRDPDNAGARARLRAIGRGGG